jgi:hypothetical protein
MRENYKFAGFSADVASFEGAERYASTFLERILIALPDHDQWSMIEFMGDGGYTFDQLIQRKFATSPDVIIVGCLNSMVSRGIRMQIHDPADQEQAKNFLVPYTERPSFIGAFMDTFGEPGMQRFSRDLVITCELTERTEAIARDLIRFYTFDGLSFDAMAVQAQALSDRESKMMDQWRVRRSE